jgi:hypothetical protein
VQSQFISKSGGNQFRGTFYGGYSPGKWQAFNIDDDQIARGLRGGGNLAPQDVNRLDKYQDTNVGLGGYVVKDRLWWYGSYRHQDIKASYVNFPVKPQTTILNNAAVAEETAAALRLVAARRRHRHQFDRVDDVEPELLGVGAQSRMERRHQRQRVRRNSRRPVRL